ncbi:tryptophan 5-hydroxylase 1-like [Amphibalanus amphitrite]|uniref:tryptophan 5-hydroxylase 1-like n=1 Tax=Amphibalanus amphitrite TaxID=1232801 RepID=UPI001C90C5BF|nr:tryptophan 5-hydroxylase 1-like [Amphibalanus amphitrite]
MSATGKSMLGPWLYQKDRDSWVTSSGRSMRSLDGGKGITNSVIFPLKNGMESGLSQALAVMQERGVNVVHIESRKARSMDAEYEIYMGLDCDGMDMQSLAEELARVLETPIKPGFSREGLAKRSMSIQSSFDFGDIPWFPRKLSDLDKSQRVLMYGSELDADHPGFKDTEYRKRRKHFYDIAMKYRFNQPIPRVEYTEEETKTWGVIFSQLSELYETHACKEYLENWRELRKYCGYRQNHIPQLVDVDAYLRQRTGFQLRPVAGYLSPRDFLAGLAFRVFHCTQYIRHSSDPLYTPEPDCCHELLGHMPLLANASFAQFSQELGLASLGASEEEISKLATCYFFTVEFGLCRENGQLRVYGAGLLSSIAELKHSLTPAATVRRFDPDVTSNEECIITAFQNVYYYTDTFEEAKEKMRAYAATIVRPFGVRYNPYTHTVDVLSSTQKVAALVSELRGDLCIVTNALKKIQENDEDADVEAITQLLSAALPAEASRTPSPPPAVTPEPLANHSAGTETAANHSAGTETAANHSAGTETAANHNGGIETATNHT